MLYLKHAIDKCIPSINSRVGYVLKSIRWPCNTHPAIACWSCICFGTELCCFSFQPLPEIWQDKVRQEKYPRVIIGWFQHMRLQKGQLSTACLKILSNLLLLGLQCIHHCLRLLRGAQLWPEVLHRNTSGVAIKRSSWRLLSESAGMLCTSPAYAGVSNARQSAANGWHGQTIKLAPIRLFCASPALHRQLKSCSAPFNCPSSTTTS